VLEKGKLAFICMMYEGNCRYIELCLCLSFVSCTVATLVLRLTHRTNRDAVLSVTVKFGV
jgi:hypothetical protein